MPRQIHSESNSTIPSFCLEAIPLAVRVLSTWSCFVSRRGFNSSQRLMGKPLGLLVQPEPGVTRVSPRRIGRTRPTPGHADGHPRALPVSCGSAEPWAPLPKPLSLLEQHLGFQQLTLEEPLPLAQPWGLRGQGVQGGTPEHGQGTRPPLPRASWGIKPESSNHRAKVCIPTCTLTSSYIFIWLCST